MQYIDGRMQNSRTQFSFISLEELIIHTNGYRYTCKNVYIERDRGEILYLSGTS